MIELAFDIASGANYKFNTAFLGEQASGHGTPVGYIALYVPLCRKQGRRRKQTCPPFGFYELPDTTRSLFPVVFIFPLLHCSHHRR